VVALVSLDSRLLSKQRQQSFYQSNRLRQNSIAKLKLSKQCFKHHPLIFWRADVSCQGLWT